MEKKAKDGKNKSIWLAALMAAGILLLSIAYIREENDTVPVYSSVSTRETTSAYHTEEEARLAALLQSMEGIGRVRIMAASDKETSGVVVVAEGAEEYQVCWKIVHATCAALGVSPENVHVFAMGEWEDAVE